MWKSWEAWLELGQNFPKFCPVWRRFLQSMDASEFCSVDRGPRASRVERAGVDSVEPRFSGGPGAEFTKLQNKNMREKETNMSADIANLLHFHVVKGDADSVRTAEETQWIHICPFFCLGCGPFVSFHLDSSRLNVNDTTLNGGSYFLI